MFNRQLIHDVINQACVPPPPPPPSPAPARRVKSRLTQGREGESRKEGERAGAFNKVYCSGMEPTRHIPPGLILMGP